MVWWIVGGVVLFALVLLAVVTGGTLGRAGAMRRAMGTAQRREAEVAGLQQRVADLQESLASLETRAGTTQERLAAIQANRDTGPDSGQASAKRTIAGALARRRRR